MSSDTLPGEQDVLAGITTLRIMCPNGEMPKEFRAGFWRLMDDVHAEIARLRAENRALRIGAGANTPRGASKRNCAQEGCTAVSPHAFSNELAIKFWCAEHSACPREGCPYVGGPDFSIGNPCRCNG